MFFSRFSSITNSTTKIRYTIACKQQSFSFVQFYLCASHVIVIIAYFNSLSDSHTKQIAITPKKNRATVAGASLSTSIYLDWKLVDASSIAGMHTSARTRQHLKKKGCNMSSHNSMVSC